jgi:hypothetical protein
MDFLGILDRNTGEFKIEPKLTEFAGSEEQTYVLQKMIQTAEMMRCVGRKTSNLPFQ